MKKYQNETLTWLNLSEFKKNVSITYSGKTQFFETYGKIRITFQLYKFETSCTVSNFQLHQMCKLQKIIQIKNIITRSR